MTAFATVMVALLLLVMPVLVTRKFFRQTAASQQRPPRSDQRSHSDPAHSRETAPTEQWTALDDVQLTRLLQHPPDADGSKSLAE